VGKWAETCAVGNAKRCPRQAGRFERSSNCPLVHRPRPRPRFSIDAPNLFPSWAASSWHSAWSTHRSPFFPSC